MIACCYDVFLAVDKRHTTVDLVVGVGEAVERHVCLVVYLLCCKARNVELVAKFYLAVDLWHNTRLDVFPILYVLMVDSGV